MSSYVRAGQFSLQQEAIIAALGSTPTPAITLACNLETTPQSLKVQIHHLRRKGVRINSIRGRGYYIPQGDTDVS